MEDPALCANGCGFFGTAANQNYCSKCYKDFLKKEEENSAKEKAKAMAKDTSQLSLSSDKNTEKKTITVTDDSSTKKKTARCGKCNKKAGVVGFKCRCGTLFCSIHRLPEEHDCNFDYKAMGREILIKENPSVKADKLEER